MSKWRARGQSGLAAVELVVLTPFVIAMLLLVVGFGRTTRARQLVDQAAWAAARAAALSGSPAQARTDGVAAVDQTLRDAGLSCTALGVDVDTSAYHAGGQVSVAVHCTADLSGLALAGLPGSVHMTGTARSPLESHRDLFATEDSP